MNWDSLTDALLLSYREQGGTNHLGGAALPSQATVNGLALSFMHLLFPGYFERTCEDSENPADCIRRNLRTLGIGLEDELGKCLRHAGRDPAEAAPLIRQLLEALPTIRRLLRTDVEAAYIGDPAARSYEEIILAYPCILAISLQRVAHLLYEQEVPLLPRMLTEYAHRQTGIDIHPGATIGSHFFIDHGTGVVIGETTTIGSHVKLYQGVTLGAKSFKTDASGKIIKGIKRHPDIGDHVTIYAGATILGGETQVGSNCIIGSNVWLMQSIPDDSIAYYKGENLVVRSRRAREEAEESSSS
ncbi:MAG: serine acetyltransferase [Puniceicoccaceae bacterium]|nr:MAG: serine acetyltransferase [Puniceicoccaceae bacterium]